MAQYISKSALIAQIERIKEMYCYDTKTNASFVAEAVINSINNAINSIEVKEMDLDTELEHYKEEQNIRYEEDINMFDFAKYFFELGLKAQKEE